MGRPSLHSDLERKFQRFLPHVGPDSTTLITAIPSDPVQTRKQQTTLNDKLH